MRNRAPPLLGVAVAALGVQALFSGSKGRPCRASWLGLDSGLPDHGNQPGYSILTILFLGPEATGLDNQNTVFGKAPARQAYQALAYVSGQGRGPAHVKAELHGGGNLVDILSPGPGGMDELLLDLCFINSNG